VRAHAAVVADADGRGATRLSRIRSEAPLVLRAAPDALYLVGGAAGPLGGDDLTIDITVGAGASLTVRSSAATVTLAGTGAESTVTVHAVVGEGAALRWMPEPTVVAARSRHRMTAQIEVAAGGRLEWWEELLLGRHGEPPGSVVSRLAIDVAGRPLLRHELALGAGHPGWDSPAVTGGVRAAGSVTRVDPCWLATPPAVVRPPPGVAVATLRLDGPGVQVVALAPDRLSLQRLLGAANNEDAATAPYRDDFIGRKPAGNVNRLELATCPGDVGRSSRGLTSPA
jgi:urease accessory protein